MTVTQLASTLYPNLTYDTALPQPWVDQQTAAGFDPRGQVVWGYSQGFLFGAPFPLTKDAEDYLRELNPALEEVWRREHVDTIGPLY